jgi:hypothetical protein
VKFDESTLDGWAQQGAKVQSAATYQTIKNVLEDPSSPYYTRSFDVFLQGSYGNETNIKADSDVDVVICLTSVYYDDLDWLNDGERSLYNSLTSGGGYSLSQFKDSVVQWLQDNFGSDVVVGKKAVFIKGNSSRRDADVLICAEHRLYRSYTATNSSDYHSGVVFWTTDGTRIVNFPKQHQENLSSRNQSYHSRLKPLVRIAKNLRNRMQDDTVLAEGKAPSYFLEGLLWNMPYSQYQYTHRGTIDAFANWLAALDTSNFTCANGIHYLVRQNLPTSWKSDDCVAFRRALLNYWT